MFEIESDVLTGWYHITRRNVIKITSHMNKTKHNKKNNDILQMPTTSINFCSIVDFRRFFLNCGRHRFSLTQFNYHEILQSFLICSSHPVVILLANVIFQYIWNYLWRGHTLKVLHWHRIVHRSPNHIAFIHLNAIRWT